MIKQKEYQARRAALLQGLEPGSVVVIRGGELKTRSNDTAYAFRQNSHFYYLTGFEEPNAAMVLVADDKTPYHLFLRPNCYEEELWDGPRAGLPGAKSDFLADQSHNIADFDEIFLSLLANKKQICYLIGEDRKLDEALPRYLETLSKQKRKGVESPTLIKDLSEELSEMRLIKSDAERALLRKVSQISAEAHVNAMKKAPSALYEYELSAGLLHDFLSKGCKAQAYDSIVGAGKNACVLHYIKNDEKIQKDDLILIDAGGELNNYAADITRTFPASGSFSDDQKSIYNLVLKSQLAAIDLVKPGVCWTALQETIVAILTEGLCELGILKEKTETCIEKQLYKAFYMHNSGHWLGIDVHDVGSYKEDGEWRTLKEGMVLTIEPGIYIASHHEGVDSRWHNIGVRIEDDILVTDKGCEVLTAAVPKTVEEIEALMGA